VDTFVFEIYKYEKILRTAAYYNQKIAIYAKMSQAGQ